jgi:hypothetical protein
LACLQALEDASHITQLQLRRALEAN